MNKKTLIIVVLIVIGSVAFFIIFPRGNNKENGGSALISCLAKNDVIIYGLQSCPHCQKLVKSLGGYEVAEPIYIECSSAGSKKEQQRCQREMKTGYVPEIQIEGELYTGDKSPSELAKEVGCESQLN